MPKLGQRVTWLLKQPWFWIVLLDLIWEFLLWPLLDSPRILYPVLLVSWYDHWEEFAAFRLYGFLAVGSGFLMLSSLAITISALFARNARDWKKAGIVFGCICLVLFTFIAGMPPLGRATERAKTTAPAQPSCRPFARSVSTSCAPTPFRRCESATLTGARTRTGSVPSFVGTDPRVIMACPISSPRSSAATS